MPRKWIHRKLISTVTASLFFLNIFTAEAQALAPQLLTASEEKSTLFQAAAICEIIEKRAAYGKPLEDIYLDDILLWKKSTEGVFDGCRFEISPDQIIIHLPRSDIAIRYYDSNPAKSKTLIPFALLKERNKELAREYDELLASISFVNGFEILRNADLTDMYLIHHVVYVYWKERGKGRMEIRFEDVSADEFKRTMKVLCDRIVEKAEKGISQPGKGDDDDAKDAELVFTMRGDTLVIASKARLEAQKNERISVYGDFFEKNSNVISAMVADNKSPVLLRVPVEGLDQVGAENAKSLLNAFDSAPNGYIGLYYMNGINDVPRQVYEAYGIAKAVPGDFKRSRGNTITLLPVFKGEEIDRATVSLRLGSVELAPEDTIIAPIGLQSDAAGLARSAVMGLRLMHIARQKGELGTIDERFVMETLEQYRILSAAYEVKPFDLTAQDIINLATGRGTTLIDTLKKLIRLLPIMPVNAGELKRIYERAKEVLSAA